MSSTRPTAGPFCPEENIEPTVETVGAVLSCKAVWRLKATERNARFSRALREYCTNSMRDFLSSVFLSTRLLFMVRGFQLAFVLRAGSFTSILAKLCTPHVPVLLLLQPHPSLISLIVSADVKTDVCLLLLPPVIMARGEHEE